MSREEVHAAAAGATERAVDKVPYWDPRRPAPLLDTSELAKWSLYRAVIAEFTATLILLYVSVATVIGYKNQSSGGATAVGVGYLGVAWSFGATVTLLVYCTSGVSGGHINPAVTLALFLARKLSLARAVLYVAAQCLGAVCGVGIVKAVMKHPYDSLGGGANSVSDGYSVGGALGAEVAGTFVLVYAVFSALDPKRTAHDSFVPVVPALPIGLAVFVVHLATIPVTGTGINPARSLGAAVLYNQHKAWKHHWIFWVGPLTGAAAAAFYHNFVLRDDEAIKEELAKAKIDEAIKEELAKAKIEEQARTHVCMRSIAAAV